MPTGVYILNAGSSPDDFYLYCPTDSVTAPPPPLQEASPCLLPPASTSCSPSSASYLEQQCGQVAQQLCLVAHTSLVVLDTTGATLGAADLRREWCVWAGAEESRGWMQLTMTDCATM